MDGAHFMKAVSGSRERRGELAERSSELQWRHRFEKGEPVPHWQEVTGANLGFNTYGQIPKPTEGFLQLVVSEELMLIQNLHTPVRAGTTYRLSLDVGSAPPHGFSEAIVRFFGSDAGFDSPLHEITVHPSKAGWLRNQVLSFTATESEATGQTLGIALCSKVGKVTFDNLRIFETPASGSMTPALVLAGGDDATVGLSERAPVATKFHPAPGTTDIRLDEIPIIVFDQPVRFGSGRIVLRDLSQGSETELVVGSKHTSLDGRVLRFIPPLRLADGTSQVGGIPGWESSGPVSRYNPSGNGRYYDHPDLAEISGSTPPGPPNRVTPVGFSWDSRDPSDDLAVASGLVITAGIASSATVATNTQSLKDNGFLISTAVENGVGQTNRTMSHLFIFSVQDIIANEASITSIADFSTVTFNLTLVTDNALQLAGATGEYVFRYAGFFANGDTTAGVDLHTSSLGQGGSFWNNGVFQASGSAAAINSGIADTASSGQSITISGVSLTGITEANSDDDFVAFRVNYSAGQAANTVQTFSSHALTAVPKPSTALLGGLGFLALLRRAWVETVNDTSFKKRLKFCSVTAAFMIINRFT